MFIELLSRDPNAYFTWVIIVTFSICVHEYAHARAALWQGDHTAAMLGHLTLNPLKQMGWLSILMLLFVGIAFGMVPVNESNLRKRYSAALVSFAGPFANLALFLVFALVATVAIKFGQSHSATDATFDFLTNGAILNIVLFLFNMIPVPPLDGYGVFTYLFPRAYRFNQEFINGVTLFIFFVAMFSFKYFYAAGHFLTAVVQRFFYNILGIF